MQLKNRNAVICGGTVAVFAASDGGSALAGTMFNLAAGMIVD